MYQSIFLLGFRASGKTTLAKHLAKKLGWKLMDMDTEITKKAGQNIAEITQNGTNWTLFRQIETDLLKALILEKNLVVSCGGGVGVNDIFDNISKQTFGELQKQILEQNPNALKIVLQAKPSVIVNRLTIDYKKNPQNRPSLQQKKIREKETPSKDLNNFIQENLNLLEKRQSLYKQLSIHQIDTSKNNQKVIIKSITDLL